MQVLFLVSASTDVFMFAFWSFFLPTWKLLGEKSVVAKKLGFGPNIMNASERQFCRDMYATYIVHNVPDFIRY